MSLAQKRKWHLHMPLSVKQFFCLLLLTGLVGGGGLALLARSAATDAQHTRMVQTGEKKTKAEFLTQSQERYDAALVIVQENETFGTTKRMAEAAGDYLCALGHRPDRVPNDDEEEVRVSESREKYLNRMVDLAATKEEREYAFLLYRQTFGGEAAKNKMPDVVPPPRQAVNRVTGKLEDVKESSASISALKSAP